MWILASLALAAQSDNIPLTSPQDETEAALHRALDAIRRAGSAQAGTAAPLPEVPAGPEAAPPPVLMPSPFAPPALPEVPEIPVRPTIAAPGQRSPQYPVPNLPTIVPWDPVASPVIRAELEREAILYARARLRALDTRRPPWDVSREFSEPDPRSGAAATVNPPWSNPTLPSTLPPQQPYAAAAGPEDITDLARKLDQAAYRRFLEEQTVHRQEHGPVYEYRWADRTLQLKRELRRLP